MSSAAAAGLLAFVSVWVVFARPPLGRAGIPRRNATGARRTLRLDNVVLSPRGQRAACVAGCGFAGWALQGARGGASGALGGAVLAWWISRREPPEVTRSRKEIARSLPLAVDLLASCVSAGHPVGLALSVVSSAIGGSLADRLDSVSARLSLGADPVSAWRLLEDEAQLASLARTMMRALESGAPIADGLRRLADDLRRSSRTSSQRAARSVGVHAAGPLALCFLPAFMLIGVVPTVASAFQHLGW